MLEFEIKKIPDEESKEYLKEVISSFENRNYRSAIVMLYAAAMSNIIDKLDYLDKNYSIKAAQSILNDIEDTNKQYTSSKETVMFKRIEKEMPYLLNKQAIATIEGLRNWRNLCAHPNLDDNSLDRLQEPSMEIVSGFIRETLDNIFLKQVYPQKNTSIQIAKDLASKKEALLTGNESTLPDFLNTNYLNKIDDNDKIYSRVLKDIFHFTYCVDDKDCSENREIYGKSLIIMIYHKKELAKQTILNDKLFNGNILIQDPDVLEQLSLLFQKFPDLFQVPNYVKDSLLTFASKDPITYLKNFFLDSKNIVVHQKYLFSSSNITYKNILDNENKLSFSEAFFDCVRYTPSYTDFKINFKTEIKNLYNLYSTNGYQTDFFKLANEIYGHSYKFVDGDNLFELWIAPYISKYDISSIDDLIDNVYRNNHNEQGVETNPYNQCSDRRDSKQDHHIVFEKYNQLQSEPLSEEEFKEKYPVFCQSW